MSNLNTGLNCFAFNISEKFKKPSNRVSFPTIWICRLIVVYKRKFSEDDFLVMFAQPLGKEIALNQATSNNVGSLLSSASRVKGEFGHVYHTLQPRVTRTLLHAFLDPTKALPQHYGAIQGLGALGPSVVRLLILPNLLPYMQLLEPEMQLEGQKNEIKRQEAWRVYGALLFAAGQCVHDHLKKFPSLPFPVTRPTSMPNKKVATMLPSKRKASIDNLQQQPPLKKLYGDGSMGLMGMNSNTLQANMQGVGGGYNADASLSVMTQPMQTENAPGSSTTRVKTSDNPDQKASILAQAWKEETDGGRLLSSLFECFGHSMFSFTPALESSMFL